MTWNDITVLDYQTIYPYIKDQSLTDIERDCKILSVLTGKKESQLDQLTYEDFKKLKTKIKFLHSGEIECKPKGVIKTKGMRFKINIDVKKIPIANHLQIKKFNGDERQIVENLHDIIALMVTPLKKTVFGWRVDNYTASKHEQYAKELQSAKFVDVFYYMVFFCNLYTNWIDEAKDYLAEQLMTKDEGVSKAQALRKIQYLSDTMNGFLRSNKLPVIKATNCN